MAVGQDQETQAMTTKMNTMNKAMTAMDVFCVFFVFFFGVARDLPLEEPRQVLPWTAIPRIPHAHCCQLCRE